MLSRIHITYSSYVQTTIDYENKLKEDIVPVISKRHPDIIIKKMIIRYQRKNIVI